MSTQPDGPPTPPSGASLAAAQLVRLLHAAILGFVVLAPLTTPSRTVLVVHVGLLLVVMMHWVTNQHYCILTLVESKLRRVPYESSFMNSLLKPLFGFGVSNRAAYAIAIILLGISITRLVCEWPRSNDDAPDLAP